MNRSATQLLVCSAVWMASACAAVDPPASTPAAPPAATPPSTTPPSTTTPAQAAPRQLPAARYPDAGALLDAAEKISATLADFSSEFTVSTTDDVTGDKERRFGNLVLMQDAGKPSTRKFAVVVTGFVDASGRLEQRPARYIYADGWLTEADFTQRTLIRRQLARPGENYDPLNPGEGPLPLPIGQRKEEVLRRFEAVLVEVPTAQELSGLKDVQGIKLTPRPGMADRDLVEAIIWYDLRTKAPKAVEVKRKNGRTSALLRNPALNAGLADEQKKLLTLAADQTEGWRVDERPLPAAKESPAAPPAQPPTL